MSVTTPLITACAGFLIAILWMDLIFDVQILAHPKASDGTPERVLASIADYYHRATTTSRPMSRLIVLVMVILLAALGFRAFRGNDPGWLTALSTALGAIPILLGVLHTVPGAVRLGKRADTTPEQARLARSICRDHVICAGCMLALLIVWLTRTW